tara:strand:+ start:21896 stop:22786 length:891 start_codon:yes stop_codon:yes gene_type:complete
MSTSCKERLLLQGLKECVRHNYPPGYMGGDVDQEEWDSARLDVLNNYNLFNPENIFEFISDKEDHYFGMVDHNASSLVSMFLEHFLKKDIAYDDLGLWKPFVSKLASLLDTNDEVRSSIRNGYNRSRNIYLLAACFSDSTDWSSLYDEYIGASYGYVSSNQDLIISQYSKKFKTEYRSFMYDHIFCKSPLDHTRRGRHYRHYVASGLLTKKEARKMRSDGSEYSSLCGLRSIIENESLYSNFEELITQFVDTRYPDVSLELAKKLPVNMLSYLAGCSHYATKRCLQKRIYDHLDER